MYLLFLLIGWAQAHKPAIVLFTGPGSGPEGALQAMRRPDPAWRVLIFSGEDSALADEFMRFARQQAASEGQVPGEPLLMVKGARYFRELSHERSPSPDTSVEIWSERYAPIVIRSWTEGESGPQLALPEQAQQARFVALPGHSDLRPIFSDFLRGYGFVPLALQPASARLERVEGAALSFAGSLSSIEPSWQRVEIDLGALLQPCGVEAFRSLRSLEVERTSATPTHAYLQVRLTLQRCDWEAGGCGCQVQTGPDAVPRLLVLERQAVGQRPVRADVLSLQSPVSQWEGFR